MTRSARFTAVAACAVLAAVIAPGLGHSADDEPRDATRGGVIHVVVGETVERDVGFAIGLLCNDLSVIQAELRSGSAESNVFRVTGVQPGETRCRVGTDPSRPSFVFEIHVTARHGAPP